MSGRTGLTSLKDRFIGYVKGWYDAVLVAFKIRKTTVNDGSVDNTK